LTIAAMTQPTSPSPEMDETRVFSEIVAILKRFARNQDALAQATPQTTFLKDLRVNSARLVDIVIQIQDRFGIELTDEEADKVRSVGDAVKLVVAKLGTP
jgi:acyl carrier protein